MFLTLGCIVLAPAAVAGIGLAVSAISTGVGLYAQSRAASQQQDAQDRMSASEKQRALAEGSATRLKQQQEDQARAFDLQKIQKESQAAIATARTSAGEGGVSGGSVDALVADFSRQELDYRESSNRQKQFSDLNYDDLIKAQSTGSAFNLARINQPVSQPNFFGAALRIGSAGLDAATYYNNSLDTKARTALRA